MNEQIFNECRGIMGTENPGQDDALRRALLHYVERSLTASADSAQDERSAPKESVASICERLRAMRLGPCNDAADYIEWQARASLASNLQAGEPIPFNAIGKILNECMSAAVKNGANSISMPDEYVAVAHFLSFPAEYTAPQAQQSKPFNNRCCHKTATKRCDGCPYAEQGEAAQC